MLEKIKVLKTKGEILKALISLADDENERKEHQRALKSVKNELLKMLDNLTPKQQQEPNAQRNLAEILADNDILVDDEQ